MIACQWAKALESKYQECLTVEKQVIGRKSE